MPPWFADNWDLAQQVRQSHTIIIIVYNFIDICALNQIFLPYSEGAVALTSGFTNGATAQQIWLDSVGCVGTELTLASCSHQPFGTHDCSHIEDVGVRCNPVERAYLYIAKLRSCHDNMLN